MKARARLVLLVATGCTSSVGATHPIAADYARSDVPSEMQADIETALAAEESYASRSALSCILSVAYGERRKAAELDRAAYRSALHLPSPKSSDDRRPPMPDCDNLDEPMHFCNAASKSADRAVAAIGVKYGARAGALSPQGRKAELDAQAVETIALLIQRGDMNTAYRKLAGLRASGALPAVEVRLDALEAQNHDALAVEATFEAAPDVRLLRRHIDDVEREIRARDARGQSAGARDAERRDLEALLRQKHAAFVDGRR